MTRSGWLKFTVSSKNVFGLRFSHDTQVHSVKRFSFSTSASSGNGPSVVPVGFNIISPGLFQARNPLLNLRSVPSHIQLPPYVKSLRAGLPKLQVNLNDPVRINAIRKSSRLAKKTLNYVGRHVRAGIATDELDRIAFEFITGHNAYPSPLMYRKFPKSICTSVNNVACHGIPDSRQLQPGDIVNIDVTVYLDGYHGDCSTMFGVGEIDLAAQHLMDTTRHSLMEAIRFCRNGERVSEIGRIIETVAEDAGYDVVPNVIGHGIGCEFHMLPHIIHISPDRMEDHDVDKTVMATGMVFTIEPLLIEGSTQLVQLRDGWTLVSADDSRSAQCEETILITDTGAEILTSA